LHGFADAADYYARNSSQNWLAAIEVPTLLLTAGNDPILSPSCYPREAASSSSRFHLEETAWGGHVGFRLPGLRYYSELRALAFVAEIVEENAHG
jgi:predicted alpha/beta-fold hydrolase